MIEIWADFNAKFDDDTISLMNQTTMTAIEAYWPSGNVVGNKVFLCDGEIGCVAIIEDAGEGHLVGKPISEYVDMDN